MLVQYSSTELKQQVSYDVRKNFADSRQEDADGGKTKTVFLCLLTNFSIIERGE